MTADISGAKYSGVVANGAKVNVTGSTVHGIGDQPVSPSNPLFGMQRGRAISYINGASGTISGNKVYDFQKSGIEVSGGTVDGGSVRASTTTSATVSNNVVTGAGPIDLHRPERHRDPDRRQRHREQEHRQQLVVHRRTTTEATGVLLLRGRPGQRPEQQDLRLQRGVPIYDGGRRRRPRQALISDRPTQTGVSHAEAPVFLCPRKLRGAG